MATIVGALGVDLELNSASFINNMKRTVDSVDRSSKSIASSLSFAKNATSAFFAGFSAEKIGETISKGLDFASSLGEQAQQLGATTKELQVYRYAASQVGISNEEMDAGLAKLTLRIGQAAAGNSKLGNVFSSLGIAITDSAGNARATGDVFEDLAGKLSKIEDPAKRAQIEVALFGKAGQRLDTLLTEGKTGIDEYAAAAARLGIVLDDNLIKQADDAADKMGALSKVLDARISVAVAENAEAIYGMANALTALTTQAIQFINQYPRLAAALTGAATGAALGGVPGAGIGAALGIVGGDRMARSKDDQNMDLSFRLKKLEEAHAELASRKDYAKSGSIFRLRRSKADGGTIETAQREVERQQALLAQALAPPPSPPKPARVAPPLPAAAGGGRAGNSRGGSSAKTLDDELAVLERTLDPVKAANLEFEKNIDILRRAADQGKITSSRYGELHDALFRNWQREGDTPLGRAPLALQHLDEAISLALPKIEDLKVQLQDVPTALDQAFAEANVAGMDAFIGSIENMRRGFGSLKDVALNVLDAIEGAILDKLVYGPLRDWASGASAGGGGLLGGLFSAGSSLIGSLFGGKKALGGSVSAGRVYRVGEQGEELFSPGVSGTIIPNAALRGDGAARTGDIYNNITGNLLTPEFWAQIQAMNTAAAQAGSDLAISRLNRSGSRRLGA